MKRRLFLLLVLVFLQWVKTEAQTTPAPEGWKKVTACQFTFNLPNDMQGVPQWPVDSCLAGYENEEISIELDYGWYSGPGGQQDWEKVYRTSSIKINGRTAELITYVIDTDKMKTKHPLVTHIHLITHAPKKGKLRTTTSLLFTISCTEAVVQSVVKQIYESIRFVGD